MATPVLLSSISSFSNAATSNEFFSRSNYKLAHFSSITPKQHHLISTDYKYSLLHNRHLISTASRPLLQSKRPSYSFSVQAIDTSLGVVDSDSTDSTDILYDFQPFIRVYKDGRVERLSGTDKVQPICVESKDVKIAPELNVSARVYIPKNRGTKQKLPLLVYIHGGAFVTESAFSPTYHGYMNSLVAEANVIAVSIDYRVAPEHRLPIAYDDSWLALKWVVSHSKGNGHEEWLNNYADFGRVYLGGDSAGGNIAYNVAMRVGLENLDNGVKLSGLFLNCPFFWGEFPIGNEVNIPERRDSTKKLWSYINPNTTGLDDPMMNPAMNSKLSSLGCTNLLIFVAGNDFLRDRGYYFKQSLIRSGWKGIASVFETPGEDHVFNLNTPPTAKAIEVLKKTAAFINPEYV